MSSDNVHGSHVTEKDESGDSHVTKRSEEGGRVATLGLRLRQNCYYTTDQGVRSLTDSLASFPGVPTIQFLTFAYCHKLDSGKAWK